MMRRRIAPTLGAPIPPRVTARPATPPPRPPRVRVAGVVEIKSGNGHNPRFRLYDLSASGFCFESGSGVAAPGGFLRGSLEIIVDGIAVTLFAAFEVGGHDRVGSRVHCRFVNLGEQEQSVLRYLVAARLNGRTVQAAEILRHQPPA